MAINKCRVCKNDFFDKPLLEYENMPSIAQNFPDKNSIKRDKGIDLSICQCSSCGLVQLNNEPVPYYKEVIRASAFSDEMREFRFKQFKNFVNKYNLKGKKIIEIGCGKGEYLSIMKQTGINAYGLEESLESVEECIKQGLEVEPGFVEDQDYKINKGPFNAFFMLSFLEHLPDPNQVLRGIGNNLLESSVGIIEVPNFDMVLRKKLFSEFTRDHLSYFTKDSLESTLKMNGYDILDCNEIWHDYIISSVVKKRKILDIGNFNKHQNEIKKNINGYVDSFKQNGVAIWGAGHQALAMISLMDLKDKIKYVVDSAPFKQGKYTPATHLPIVSPEKLNIEPVEAVIIMAAAYSDEVARIIQERYYNCKNIAILRDYGLEIVKRIKQNGK